MAKFVESDRDQPYLLPPDLRDWIPSDDLVHFVLEAVERVSMSAFKVNERGTGSAQWRRSPRRSWKFCCWRGNLLRRSRLLVEPVFGIVKQAMGFRQFLMRGVDKVEGEWTLVMLAYNCRRLNNLMAAT